MRHGDAEADQAEKHHNQRASEDEEERTEHRKRLRRERLARGDDKR